MIKQRPLGLTIAAYAGYVLLFLFFILPILTILSLSLKTPAEIFSPATIRNLIPENPTLDNYKTVMVNVRMNVYILNSAKLVISTVLGVLIISSLSSYALSRFHFRKKNLMILIILMFQMISPIVIGIPLYWYYSRLHLLDTYFGLAIAYIAIQLPFATFLLKGVFDGIPVEMDEAAKIDGCSRLMTLIKVILPVSLPGIASAIIFLSINAWSQFVLPFFLLNKDQMYPVSVGILLSQGTFKDISTHYVAAASMIGLLPAVILVLFLQKFILKALLSGAVKG
jgi:multiple sugar transport system permease protein